MEFHNAIYLEVVVLSSSNYSIKADISIEYRSDDVTKIIFWKFMGYDVIFLQRILSDALIPKINSELQFLMEEI